MNKMLLSSLTVISLPEANLIDTIQQLQYGELYGIEIEVTDLDNEDLSLSRTLSPAMRDLISYIREGCQSIDILTIHNGQPTCAETDFKLNGFRCRRKTKFPTK
jgi:hypothetical protein